MGTQTKIVVIKAKEIIYTGIFLAIYLLIWVIVVASVTATAQKLNKKIEGR